MKHRVRQFIIESIAIIISLILFGIPLVFVVLNAGKNPAEAARMSFTLPQTFEFSNNFKAVITASNSMLLRSFINSTIITIGSIVVLIIISSSAGFILGRRKNKTITVINFLILAGLMVPPAIVPTIWLLKAIGLYKSVIGLILVEGALFFPFSVMLYRGYVGAIPRELDEASFIDGSSSLRLFTSVMFPLMKPVTVTVIIITAINIFNDFVNPLYFLPGAKNSTVQLTLYNFMSTFSTKWNLLYADVLLISIPPLIFFIIFNKKIVSGMVAGAIKA